MTTSDLTAKLCGKSAVPASGSGLRGVAQLEARNAHNVQVAGSSPVPATIVRIPLHNILLPANVPAGLSPWLLFAISHELRNAGRDVRHPIVVQRLIGLDLWRIVDGRHRYCAAVMAGVRDILATEVP